MGRTRIRDVRTDGRTTQRLYAPPKFFGEHKNMNAKISPSEKLGAEDCSFDSPVVFPVIRSACLRRAISRRRCSSSSVNGLYKKSDLLV
jgi:hypothetical protein